MQGVKILNNQDVDKSISDIVATTKSGESRDGTKGTKKKI